MSTELVSVASAIEIGTKFRLGKLAQYFESIFAAQGFTELPRCARNEEGGLV